MSTTAVGPWRLVDDPELATTPEDTRGLVETKVGPTGKETIGANVAAVGESPIVIAGSWIPGVAEAAIPWQYSLHQEGMTTMEQLKVH